MLESELVRFGYIGDCREGQIPRSLLRSPWLDGEITIKLSGPYPTMYNRDEIFFRLGIEKNFYKKSDVQRTLTFKTIQGFHIFIEHVRRII